MITNISLAKFTNLSTPLSYEQRVCDSSSILNKTIKQLEDAKKYGLEIDPAELRRLEEQRTISTSKYKLQEAPDFWPFTNINIILRALPERYKDLLDNIVIGYLTKEEINAMAWSYYKEIGILQGLSDFVIACSQVGTVVPKITDSTLHPALYYCSELRQNASNLLFAKSRKEAIVSSLLSLNAAAKLRKDYIQLYVRIFAMQESQANDSIMFVILHELAHVLLEHSYSLGYPKEQEFAADMFATECMSQGFANGLPINSISGLLIFSYLELLEAIHEVTNGEPNENNNSEPTHPPAVQRRRKAINKAIESLRTKGTKDDFISIALDIAHRFHINLSSELLSRRLDPLAPFHTSLSAEACPNASIISKRNLLSKNYPAKVLEIEGEPFNAA